jgi:hypothetical protein
MGETITGGGFVGSSKYFGYRGTWPFSSLSVDFDAITFRLFPISYRIEKENITHLIENKMWVFASIQIVHTKDGIPKCIYFSPIRPSALRELLSQFNYKISSKDEVQGTGDSNVKYSKAIGIISMVAAVLGVLAAIYAMTVKR